MVVIFKFVWTVAFDTPWTLYTIYECNVVLFLVVLILEDLRVYICILYSSNEVVNVKTPINKTFILQNKLLTYLWYLNLRYTFRGLGVIQKFNNNDNND